MIIDVLDQDPKYRKYRREQFRVQILGDRRRLLDPTEGEGSLPEAVGTDPHGGLPAPK